MNWSTGLKRLATKFLTLFFAFNIFFGWTLLLSGEYRPLYYGAVVIILLGAIFSVQRERLRDLTKKNVQLQEDKDLLKKSLVERASGFPTLLKALEDYEAQRDQALVTFLRQKRHPARRASDVVGEETRRRRQAQTDLKRVKLLLEYYESIAPFLLDFKEEIGFSEEEDLLAEYSEEEKLDPVVDYLRKDEFRKLPSQERNQLALDRFWKRPKSKWLVGRLYERYIGYLYEREEYDVEYVGIFKGYEDLGRDLICRKGNNVVVVQCKNWSQFRTIYEKHIFQFFGTVFQYRDSNPGKKVNGVFCTSTQLSDLARRFAEELNIELKENFSLDVSYPSIKCNVSRLDGTKIYHLPFDQQYDRVKIEPKRGEFYCSTVKEAEERGFRRAFRYRGGGGIVTGSV